jgi:hypothetical protein
MVLRLIDKKECATRKSMHVERVLAPITCILIVVVTAMTVACSHPRETTTVRYQPRLTVTQAKGLVVSALTNSGKGTLILLGQDGYFEWEFNQDTRQWIITVWADKSLHDGKHIGNVYLVDDATGKVLNPP